MLFLKKGIFSILAFILLLLSFSFSQAQTTAEPGVKNILSSLENYNAALTPEKLYLRFDKPYYNTGDTVWFKAYILNASSYAYSVSSARLYVELLSDSSKLIKRITVPVSSGVCWGNIALDQEDLPDGAYTIRAYTNWLQNFGNDYFFYRRLYIGNPAADPWLASASHTVNPSGDVNLSMQLGKLNDLPVGLQDIQLKVMDGKKVLYNNPLRTSASGAVELNFKLPEKLAQGLSVIAIDKSSGQKKVMLPLSISRPQNLDLQFMPESGPLVAGLPALVGFKAIAENGKGVDVEGEITDSRHNKVASFKSTHLGMGTVSFTPQAGETYTAQLTAPADNRKPYALPAVKSTGIIMHIRNGRENDSLQVTVNATSDLVNGKTYYLIAQSRGVVCYAANVVLNKESKNAQIAKSLFPSGIAHLTILDTDKKPVNERLVYIDRHDNLNIAINTQRSAFSTRDSIPLQVSVKDAAGKPVVGSFSVSVTDDAQVKDRATSNMITHLLLTSDLKGNVEDPLWYFTAGAPGTWEALDALLLTQGWIGYNWQKTLSAPPKPLYQPETDLSVSGQVTNALKPVANARVLLISTGKRSFFRDAVTDAGGKFRFTKLPLTDTIGYILQARTSHGRIMNAAIKVNDFKPTSLKAPAGMPDALPNAGNDSTYINYVKNNLNYKKELYKLKYPENNHMLEAVKVTGKKSVKGSSNPNGAGEADIVLDENDMEAAGKMTLLDVLQKRVEGFGARFVGKGQNVAMEYMLKNKKLNITIDSININQFFTSSAAMGGPPVPNEHYEYVKGILEYITAEDVKGIEVMLSQKYVARYDAQLNAEDQLAIQPTRGGDNAYIEITTRSGQGPFVRSSSGVYAYKPVPMSFPKMFYQPKYKSSSGKNFADLRATVFWQPSLVTNMQGSAFSSFYSAGRPATYTIIVEGSDMNGKIGYQVKKLTIKN